MKQLAILQVFMIIVLNSKFGKTIKNE